MARPDKKPILNPRKPATVLGWSLQKFRQVHGWSGKETASAFGCSPAHISRVEQGKMPSRELVRFYDETFQANGMLLSLYEAAAYAPEQERRRAGGHRPRIARSVPGDASEFVSCSVTNGQLMQPGEVFSCSWRIRNAGAVPWIGRSLERQGPLTGPGLITSPRATPVPATEPGEVVEIGVLLKAPTYACCSIAYFKMVDHEGQLCFPSNYQLGLEVVVLVREQLPDSVIPVEQFPDRIKDS